MAPAMTVPILAPTEMTARRQLRMRSQQRPYSAILKLRSNTGPERIAAGDVLLQWTVPDPVNILRETFKYLPPDGRLVLADIPFGLTHSKLHQLARGIITDHLTSMKAAGVNTAQIIPCPAREAAKAEIKQKPHTTNKADSRQDPFHANLPITSKEGRKITSAHYYPVPTEGENVWFSKAKYNAGKRVMDYFPKPWNPAMDLVGKRVAAKNGACLCQSVSVS
ncbi:hypothetical protein Aspvir_010074 [Aspergillus viridinutans]|uniref:Uncharacterized protein n=1 Tax=Aspergillus viridinutans TaxID=75553 RepID=A0A9P3C4B7_ASPVI|nr:uncharacterized protein Aspvir_010074 [Aspergillus viridinutans]GIK05958.1 hypothetical protein Aspvir_010074 [Aspergillus viridinutans]